MTIISTAQEPTEFDFPLEEKGELRAFPPVNAAIDKVKSVDWEMVKIRAIIGVNFLGRGLSVVGRSIYTIGEALQKA